PHPPPRRFTSCPHRRIRSRLGEHHLRPRSDGIPRHRRRRRPPVARPPPRPRPPRRPRPLRQRAHRRLPDALGRPPRRPVRLVHAPPRLAGARLRDLLLLRGPPPHRLDRPAPPLAGDLHP